MSKKEKVVALLKSIETGDTNPIAFINAEKYTQHNLAIGWFGRVRRSSCCSP